MKISNDLLKGYENSRLIEYDALKLDFPNTIEFAKLQNEFRKGILKGNRYIDGKIIQTYSEDESHVLAIAATRLGKTTSCVIPQILSFAVQNVKRNMIVSDPKGEIYRLLSSHLKEKGYEVLLINLRDYEHSETWNPLSSIYRKYQKIHSVESEVELIETKNGLRNKLRGFIYEDQTELDIAIEKLKDILLGDAETDIDNLMNSLITAEKTKDIYWIEASRQWGKALIFSMLEDSAPSDDREVITEEKFSFNTMFSILETLTDKGCYDNNKYFSKRGERSKAYINAKTVISNAPTTRNNIVSIFSTKMMVFQSSAVRLLTTCSSFGMEKLVSETPTVVFISYPDETRVYYHLISSFVQESYNFLINYAQNKPNGKLDIPFYFILDEFGNFPYIQDFDSTITACGGRNIWFYIVLQSYAQLENIYEKSVAQIIINNLNVHIFLGSNDYETLESFSKECGKTTRISPRSALLGDKEEITNYEIETIPLMPVSRLASLKPGECVITEASCPYVLLSKMERYYNIDEFSDLELSSTKDYKSKINPLDRKYIYNASKLISVVIDDDDDDDFDF